MLCILGSSCSQKNQCKVNFSDWFDNALQTNPIHATGFFLYPLKTSENLWFFDDLRGYRKRSVA